MFDSMVGEGLGLGVMSGDQLAAAIVDDQSELLRRECRVLELACAWADLHDQTGRGLEYAPLVERACMVGGPGTPMVSEFCVTEFGALQGTGPMAARALVADALDLRYRLPMLWKQVQAGQVRAWQARKVAEQTRPLSWDACVELDAAISGFLGMLPWSRFHTILAAAILDADPELAAAREDRPPGSGCVAADSDDGLKTLIAKATSRGMWCGSWPPSTGSPTSSSWRATPIRSGCAGPKPSASSPNPPKPWRCSPRTATTQQQPVIRNRSATRTARKTPRPAVKSAGRTDAHPATLRMPPLPPAPGMCRIFALRQAQRTPRWWWIRRRAAWI